MKVIWKWERIHTKKSRAPGRFSQSNNERILWVFSLDTGGVLLVTDGHLFHHSSCNIFTSVAVMLLLFDPQRNTTLLRVRRGLGFSRAAALNQQRGPADSRWLHCHVQMYIVHVISVISNKMSKGLRETYEPEPFRRDLNHWIRVSIMWSIMKCDLDDFHDFLSSLYRSFV